MPAKSRAQQRFFGYLKSNPEERKRRGISAKDVDDFASTKHKGLPERKEKKESMNFTEFLDSAIEPLYEAEGELPKCPPGYKYDQNMKMCVPKTQKDAVGNNQKYGDKDLKPGNSQGYNVIGNSGYDGSGYAFEEPPTYNDRTNSMYEGASKDRKLYGQYKDVTNPKDPLEDKNSGLKGFLMNIRHAK